MTVSWDDKDTAMVCLTVIALGCIFVLSQVPIEYLKDVMTAIAPVLTAIVSALAGVATGRQRKQQ